MYLIEFTYNTFVNRTIDKDLMKLFMVSDLSNPIDHIPIAEHYRAPECKLTI